MKNLSQEEWSSQLKNDENAVILDVRTQEEVDGGIIPHALHHDIHEGQGFIDNLEKMDKDKNYYVYCRSGNRSGQAAQIMDQMGFANTFNLMGGFMEWDGETTYMD